MLKKDIYKKNNIYFYDEKYLALSKEIIDQKYLTLKKLKDTKRNYVALIEVKGQKFILKEPRNEYRIPQRKIMSIFKAGEALTTLQNVTELYNKGVQELILPRVVINRREKGMIAYSAIVMDYFDGEIDPAYNDEFVKLVKKMHDKDCYHGDFNPGNFLIRNKEIKIIDTQAKKICFGNYRAHYDMITMKNDSYDELQYPYSKNFYYYIALYMKKFKRLRFVEKIKEYKKKKRDNGWKI